MTGPVWYARTRVPGRRPEDTLRRLAPAHLTGGKPPTGHLTRRQAQDALADLISHERRQVGHGAYDHQPDGATFADAAAGFLRHVEHVKGREFSTIKDYRHSIRRYLEPRLGASGPLTGSALLTSRRCATTSWPPDCPHGPSCGT